MMAPPPQARPRYSAPQSQPVLQAHRGRAPRRGPGPTRAEAGPGDGVATLRARGARASPRFPGPTRGRQAGAEVAAAEGHGAPQASPDRGWTRVAPGPTPRGLAGFGPCVQEGSVTSRQPRHDPRGVGSLPGAPLGGPGQPAGPLGGGAGGAEQVLALPGPSASSGWARALSEGSLLAGTRRAQEVGCRGGAPKAPMRGGADAAGGQMMGPERRPGPRAVTPTFVTSPSGKPA